MPAAQSPVEGARPVRDEDAFDVTAVDTWLRAATASPSLRSASASDLGRVPRASASSSLRSTSGDEAADAPADGELAAGSSSLRSTSRERATGAIADAPHPAPSSSLRSTSGDRAADAAPVDGSPSLRSASEADPLPEGLPEVRQFSGGASNLTYLLRYPDRDLILRRPPAGTKAKSAHDMGREYRIQQQLAPVFPYVPRMVAHCTDDAVIGSEFYVMERIAGTIPRRSELGVELTPEQTRQLGYKLIDTLVDLHQVDAEKAGLGDLGKGEGFVERQVGGWSGRYRKVKTWNVPSFEKVMAWLEANRPADVRICVIHNDFRLDNVVLAPDDPLKIVGVLDWELATLGDPLMDLGSALAYWVQADDDWAFRRFRLQPSDVPGMIGRDEIVRYYCEKTGLDASNWAFYEVFGLFRLAVIAQQIYYRYHHKQTRNPRFKNLWLPVNLLERRCRKIMSR